MQLLELHSLKMDTTKIEIKTIGNFQITLYPFNQPKLQYQVSLGDMVVHFGQDLESCFKHITENIKEA